MKAEEIIEKYGKGKIYDGEIESEDINIMAEYFGEESDGLTDLLKFCMLNNIRTFASCKGHPEDKKKLVDRLGETGYVAFDVNGDYDLAYFLASIPHQVKDIQADVDFIAMTGRQSIAIYVPATKKGMSDKYFYQILEELKKYVILKERGESFSIDDDVKKIVDYVMSFPRNDLGFTIEYDTYYRIERPSVFVSKVSKCPRNKQTGLLHKKLVELLYKYKNVDELINQVKK